MSNNQSPSSFLIAVSQLLNHYSEAIPAGQKIKAYLAGGAAIHYWIRTRQTGDVDVEFSRQFFIDDFFVKYLDETGKEQTLYVDRSYNPMFSLLHEDYQINAIPIGKELQISTKIDLSVLSPLRLGNQ